jgi:hypothetical protein
LPPMIFLYATSFDGSIYRIDPLTAHMEIVASPGDNGIVAGLLALIADPAFQPVAVPTPQTLAGRRAMHPLLPLVLLPSAVGLCIGVIIGDRRTRRRRQAAEEAVLLANALRSKGAAPADLASIVERFERAELYLVDASPQLLTFRRPSAIRSFAFTRLVYFPLEPFFTFGCWLGGEREQHVEVPL